jgi:hypothetical protein
LLQALSEEGKVRKGAFCEDLSINWKKTRHLTLVFSVEATFHLNRSVNKRNVPFWHSKNPHTSVEIQHNSPKVNIFCAFSKTKAYGPLFFTKNTISGMMYLDVLNSGCGHI